MPKVHVICHLPAGQHRGGRFNQGCTSYDKGDHTLEQLAELVRDPYHTVVIGDLVTVEQIEAMEKAAAEKAAAEKAAAEAPVEDPAPNKKAKA